MNRPLVVLTLLHSPSEKILQGCGRFQEVPSTVAFDAALFNGKSHQGRITVNYVGEFAVRHRDEQSGDDSQVNNQQTAHRRSLAKAEQQQSR